MYIRCLALVHTRESHELQMINSGACMNWLTKLITYKISGRMMVRQISLLTNLWYDHWSWSSSPLWECRQWFYSIKMSTCLALNLLVSRSSVYLHCKMAIPSLDLATSTLRVSMFQGPWFYSTLCVELQQHHGSDHWLHEAERVSMVKCSSKSAWWNQT